MIDEKYRVLILDDDEELGELLTEYLHTTNQCAVTSVQTESDFWNCLRQNYYDILFLDYRISNNTTGLDILEQMGQANINIPTVMMTGEGTQHIAARAIQAGALDYLVKGDYSLSALPPLIHKAVRLREMQRAMQKYLEQIRYQAMLLDNMRDAVVVWRLDGIISYWNAAAEQLYGASAADRLGKPVNEVYFTGFDPRPEPDDYQRAENRQIEHRYLLPDGKKIWVSAHITPLFNEGNQQEPFGFMNVARDITPSKREQEALVQSQNFIKRILDTSPNIIYILNIRRRRIRYVNAEITPILGHTVEELVNSPWESVQTLVHEEDRSVIAEHLHSLEKMRDGEVLDVAYRIITKQNEWRWLKSRAAVFSRSKDGVPLEVIGVAQDITANRLAEAQLQHRLNGEKLLATVSNKFINMEQPDTEAGIAEAMLMVSQFIQVDFGSIHRLDDGQLKPVSLTHMGEIVDLDTSKLSRMIAVSEAPWTIEKMRRQEMVVIHKPEDVPAASPADQEFFQSLSFRSIVCIPMVSNNQLFGILSFAAKQVGALWTGDDLYVLKTFGEMITNALIREEVDQALRVSEARYRAIVEDHQTEMICRFLPDTTLTFVNEAYCKYYNEDRASLVGTSFLEPVLDEEKDYIRFCLSGLSTASPVHIFEQRVSLPEDGLRWQEWTSRAIFDEQNDFIEFQAVGRDITERKKMEEQIKTAQTRLTQAARLSSIGELASGVAHQISNPLTTIIGDAQILSHELGRQHPGYESAEAIVKAGWRAQKVINELMKFAQPAQAAKEPVSVNDTIQTALLLASAHIQAMGVNLELDLQPNLPEIGGNPRQLTDLWVNLLLLARSSFIDGRDHTIRIHSRQQEDQTLLVEISDDGVPILPEQYPRIFEPQLLPTGTGRGTGIELSLCREIVRQNQGQIEISGSENETTFKIIFSTEGN